MTRTVEEYEVLKRSICICTYPITLKMERTRYSETSVINEATRFHIPEDSNLHELILLMEFCSDLCSQKCIRENRPSQYSE